MNLKVFACAAVIGLAACGGEATERTTYDLRGQALQYRVFEQSSDDQRTESWIEAQGRSYVVAADLLEKGVVLAIEDDLGDRLWARVEGGVISSGWLRSSTGYSESWSAEGVASPQPIESAEDAVRSIAEKLSGDSYKTEAWNVSLPLLFDTAASWTVTTPESAAAIAAMDAVRSLRAQLEGSNRDSLPSETQMDLGGSCKLYKFERIYNDEGGYWSKTEVCRITCSGTDLPVCSNNSCTCIDAPLPDSGGVS